MTSHGAARPEISKQPVLRVARPTNDLLPLRAFYCDGLGFEVLSEFTDHSGFDGLIVGHAHAPYHLEFVRERGDMVPPAPTEEHLLVLYLPDTPQWHAAVARMEAAGFPTVRPHNPFWTLSGACFRDPDGYHVVLQNAAWSR
jgi:catechol 2,3-dioxygenase-like lactoylglutathione lyase family enzyme